MEPKEFTTLLRDVISHLYDHTVLETHPLIAVIVPPVNYQGSRGDYLRQVIEAEIEQFKPAGKPYDLHSLEWRPYLILQKRYLEGLSLQTISGQLALSERQIRRDTSRALQALAGRLWDQLVDRALMIPAPGSHQARAFPTTPRQTFDIQPEILALDSIIQGVAAILVRRLQGDGLVLQVTSPSEALRVLADRVVVRQVLISLLSYPLNFSCQPEIRLGYGAREQQAVVHIQAWICDPWSREDEHSQADMLQAARFWGQQIGASITVRHPQEGQTGEIVLEMILPLAEQPAILVVDDQKPTQQMFQRFLSRKPYQVIGITAPEQVLPMARQLQPALITLDVMMPKVDGWEILQALQADEQTRTIPVLVCSAWEEPELAISLGAAAFLKKPVRQQELLEALEGLGL